MTQLSAILEQQLNRKEFLKYLGALLLTVVGISSIIKNLSNLHGPSRRTVASGYGSSPYGGRHV